MAPSITPGSTHYALVVDAGSSGSRLQIYSWRDPDLERAEIVADVKETVWGRAGGRKWWWPPGYKGKGKEREGELERRALRRLVRVGKGVEGDAWVKRVEPGISSQHPKDISDYLAPLMSHALQQIPPSQHSSTPIYLYATAGMRLLPQGTQDAILKATCDTLRRDYPFAIGRPSAAGPCGENIRVISGEEEGMWGWVAVNYLMDGFGHAPPYDTDTAAQSSSTNLLPLAPLAEAPPSSSKESVTPVDVNHHSPTFGFLDMGGASTQLAFSPTSQELARSGFPENELRSVSLRLLSGEEVDWPVFVASWLGFGTNRVRERYVEKLLEEWKLKGGDTGKIISDPCLPSGLIISGEDPTTPDLRGTGSFTTCLKELKPLLGHDTACPTNHCLFAGLPTPHIDFEREDQRGFIGVSEYWYTASQVLGLGGVWDWGEWEKGMSAFCARDWRSIEDQVEKEQGWLGAEVELSRLQMQCFKGAWISDVLHEGIGIPRIVDKGGNDTLTGGELGETNAEANRRAKQKGLFQSMDEIDQTAISWTLGKMVIEASKAVEPRSALMESAWRHRLPHLNFDQFEQGLEKVGIQAIWAYGFLGICLIFILFSGIRRKFGLLSSTSKSPRNRFRKPSISNGSSPFTPTTTRWVLPWSTNKSPGEYSLEDGPEPSLSRSSRTSFGRIRLMTLRLGNALRRNLPFGSPGGYSTLPMTSYDTNGSGIPRRSPILRHVSMPLSNSLASSAPISYSQPPSPKGSSFFTPAFTNNNGNNNNNNNLQVPPSRNSLSPSPEPYSSTQAQASSVQVSPTPTPLSSSPPRLKSISSSGGGGVGSNRPVRTRQNSGISDKSTSTSGIALSNMVNNSLGRDSSPGGSSNTGWNDPPIGMLGVSPNIYNKSALPGHVYDRDTSLNSNSGLASAPAGVLTPPALDGSGSNGVISRQGSRVNLSEIGLAQRSSSRASTPFGNYDNGEDR